MRRNTFPFSKIYCNEFDLFKIITGVYFILILLYKIYICINKDFKLKSYILTHIRKLTRHLCLEQFQYYRCGKAERCESQSYDEYKIFQPYG